MARFFVNRPIFAIVMSIIIVIAGLVILSGLPIAQYPDITPPRVQVTTSYTGADAITIEQSVATPLDQAINGVDHMLDIVSTSGNDGSMSIYVDFDVGTDANMDQVLVQNRASQATALLPGIVKQWGVTVQKTMAMPLLLFELYSPNGTYDTKFMANYANINITDALLRTPGIGTTTVFGASDYTMRMWLIPEKLAGYGLTVSDVSNAISKQNQVNPAGQIGGEPAPPDQQYTYTVRAQGRLSTPEEFGNIVIRANPDGSYVRVADIARIELGSLAYESVTRYNGKPAAVIAAYQTPGFNGLQAADGARKTVEELSKRFPPDLQYAVGLDTTLPITAGIHEVTVTLFEAIGLVLIVVFVFLQSWRATIIPMLTVPVSLIGAFIFFPLLNFSINTLSLFGLVLAIGLVVDDAIVVVENVEHWIERGLDAKEATIKSMGEITGSLIAVALVLTSVFVPVAFMQGVVGRLYQQFALTIAFSVLISAFNAITLTPALCALLLKPRQAHHKGPLYFLFDKFNRGFEKITHGYVKLSEMFVHHYVRSFGLLFVITASLFVMYERIPKGFIPIEDAGYFYVNMQLPDASSLKRTDIVLRKIEQIMAKTPGVDGTTTVGGFSIVTHMSAPYYGFQFIKLTDWDQRQKPGMNANEIIERLNEEFMKIPEAVVFAFPPPAIPGLGTTGGLDFMLQDRSGGTVDYLQQNLEKFMAEAKKHKEIASLQTMFRATVPQVFADVDRDKVTKLGVEIGDVYLTLQTFLGGYYINDFNKFGRQWKVFIQADEQSRTSTDKIGLFFVRNNQGTMIPLSTFVQMKSLHGPEFTTRYNLFRSAEILANPAEGYSTGQAIEALESTAASSMPMGMGYDWTGMTLQEKRSAGTAGPIIALAIAFVFLILAAQFESWSLPFSVLMGTPVAVCGAVVGLMGRDTPLDVFGQVGIIMLVGLAAKNSILRVTFSKQGLDEGMKPLEAALAGGERRLRPIVMTALAFILGCVPLWSADGAGAAQRRSLGTTVISGMAASTVVEIFLVPVFFYVVETISHRIKRKAVAAGIPQFPKIGIEEALERITVGIDPNERGGSGHDGEK